MTRTKHSTKSQVTPTPRTQIVTLRLMGDHSQKHQVTIDSATIFAIMPRNTFASYMAAVKRLVKGSIGRGDRNWEIVEIAQMGSSGKASRRGMRLTGYAG